MPEQIQTYTVSPGPIHIHNNTSAYSNQTTSTSVGDNSSQVSSSPSRMSYNSSGYGGGSYYGSGSSYDGYKNSGSTPGICGLSNLGNTCFMNSAIQCMSNVPELTEYFLSSDWRSELNMDNPLGMKGEIASSYAELIRNMWSGQYSYTVPRNFKVAVGRFAPQFSGYQQQDSQELMAFLLDGLHEDLNRIKKKPYIEQKDEDGRPDQEVAKEAWENYLKRNDSIIVDIFHGLLKSTLVCPECEKVSVTFDPFCYLSLPLPDKKERQIEVFFVPMDPMKKPKHYKLTVPQRGHVSHLCTALSKMNNVSHEKMVVTDVYNRRFHKVFPPEEPLTHILDRDDIFIYEIPTVGLDDPDTQILPVYMREKRVRQGYNGYQHITQQLFGQPLLVGIPRKNCDYQTLYNCVLDKMARYVKIPDDNDEWWKSAKKNSWSETKDKQVINGDVDGGMDDEDPSTKSSTSTSSSSRSSPGIDKMENGGSSSNGGTAEDEENNTDSRDVEQNEDSEEACDKKPPGLFVLQSVNSFGTTEMEPLKDDGKSLKLSSRSYVAIDWHPKAKAKFYDEKAAEELEVDETVNARLAQKKQTLQLSECLDLFTTTERLGEHDPWYCPRCKKHQRATKKFDLWKLPRVLVIHLKRFSYNRYWRDKLDTFIEYPTKGLVMKKWLLNKDHGPAVYDLEAVCNHYGGMGGGHYTAYGKNKEDSQWYYFDDSSVSSASEEAAVTKAGYVLVYRLRNAPDFQYKNIYSNGTSNTNKHNNTAAASSSQQNGNSVSGSSSSSSLGAEPSSNMYTSTNGDNSSDDEMDIN